MSDTQVAPRRGATSPPGDRPSAPRRRRPAVLLPWVVPVLLILGWQWASSTGAISPSILPPPSTVLATADQLWTSGELQWHLLVSVRRILIGFTLGASLGLLLGFLVGLSKIAEGLVDRTLQMLRALPHLALVPLLIAAFGIGELPKIVLVMLGVIFPVYLNTVAGIRTVRRCIMIRCRSSRLRARVKLASSTDPGSDTRRPYSAQTPSLPPTQFSVTLRWCRSTAGSWRPHIVAPPASRA
ncbi:ABC transporter permease [Rhodococcus sp. JS3073]|uniref:ABC transporter permease n=1 Tax=Rhodococcus sp. JS3073 TaxID=3002901 RepID=UPI00228590CA|nr:ABC transporter permease subunit [Rhodococcus sp. JS3073]WAM19558.1 ABC transporter permease subunit [Rhodococcus sp. JS3073]